jgi:hypothetical protein
MAIPRNLGNLAQGVDSSGVLGTTKGGTGLTTVGTNGQVLQSNGTALVFATPSSGSAMTLISTQTVTNGTMQWTGLTGYDRYIVKFNRLIPVTGNGIFLQFGTGSTPTWTTSGYYVVLQYSSGGGAVQVFQSTYSGAEIFGILASAAPGFYFGDVNIYGMTTTNPNTYTLSLVSTGSEQEYAYSYMNPVLSSAPTAIRIICNTGNITGSASLYGLSS